MGIVTQVHMKNKEIIKKGDKKEKKRKTKQKMPKKLHCTWAALIKQRKTKRKHQATT